MTDYRDFYRELRTDWLKLRGYLFDPNTNLPSLPIVLDGVRRRLEAGETVGLIYLDPSSGGHLEANHGWQAYDQKVRALAEALRRSSLLDTHARESLALAAVRSDELLFFPSIESEDVTPEAWLETLRAALVDELEAALREESLWFPLQSSAVELETEPTIRIERSIYQGLQQARERCRLETERRHSGRLTELQRILSEHDIVVRYQPIVDLRNGQIHGLEALSKAPTSSCFRSPDMLFSFAEKAGRILDLDRMCRKEAIGRCVPLLGAAGSIAGRKLFLNCSAEVVHDETLLPDLVAGTVAAGLGPGTVVLEITERVAITEWKRFRESLVSLRKSGMMVAIDDMGSGYSSLRAAAEIEPDYLKFDLSLISDIQTSPIKRELLTTLVTLARKIQARPIAEGIEKQEEFETVRKMGIDFGQGYFFARPAEPDQLGRIHFPLN